MLPQRQHQVLSTWTPAMPVNAVIESNLPTVDATIAAVEVAGRIVNELRGRLQDALRVIAGLEEEKATLRRELRAMADHAKGTRVDGPLEAFVRSIDTSFVRGAAPNSTGVTYYAG